MANYLERLKKLLGWVRGVNTRAPIATEIVDEDKDGVFIALSSSQEEDQKKVYDFPRDTSPAEIHIGLDFGTSYTKACWYFLNKDQRYIVRWNEKWVGAPSYFLPSCLWLDSGNSIHMVKPQVGMASEIRYFKMAVAEQFISPQVFPKGIKTTIDPYRIYSAFFIARCLEWIEQQVAMQESKSLQRKEIIWSGNIGVPISYFENKISRRYLEILTAARYLQKRIADSEPMERLESLYRESLNEPLIKTFLPVPELYAEACGIFSDYHTPEGYYSIFDIGGGTVDGAVMRFERVAGEPQVNFLTASVEALGAEVFESNNGNAKKIKDLQGKLGFQTAKLIMDAKQKAQSDWRMNTVLPIEMCGGGHASQLHVNTIQNTYYEKQHYSCGIPHYKVEDLQSQISGVKGIKPGDEIRLLIAVGLSIPEGQGPFIQGFPSQNPMITAKERERRIDLDDLQRERYGD